MIRPANIHYPARMPLFLFLVRRCRLFLMIRSRGVVRTQWPRSSSRYPYNDGKRPKSMLLMVGWYGYAIPILVRPGPRIMFRLLVYVQATTSTISEQVADGKATEAAVRGSVVVYCCRTRAAPGKSSGRHRDGRRRSWSWSWSYLASVARVRLCGFLAELETSHSSPSELGPRDTRHIIGAFSRPSSEIRLAPSTRLSFSRRHTSRRVRRNVARSCTAPTCDVI